MSLLFNGNSGFTSKLIAKIVQKQLKNNGIIMSIQDVKVNMSEEGDNIQLKVSLDGSISQKDLMTALLKSNLI